MIIKSKKIREAKKRKDELEKKLNVKIKFIKGGVEVEGSSLDEYVASIVFDAINFGFSVKKALILKDEEKMFRKVHIREHTKRNLKDIRGRVIGTKGKTRRTISEIAGCEIIVGESEIGIIGDAESVLEAETAIINIIRGAKQANAYKYLQKINRNKKERVF
ncbi:hypothetical protein HY450_03690 [Candidatus Pacearchaeota archaeon]|nr:hypothetical protein [Candidatus Pacearchaeota archaeon]